MAQIVTHYPIRTIVTAKFGIQSTNLINDLTAHIDTEEGSKIELHLFPVVQPRHPNNILVMLREIDIAIYVRIGKRYMGSNSLGIGKKVLVEELLGQY